MNSLNHCFLGKKKLALAAAITVGIASSTGIVAAQPLPSDEPETITPEIIIQEVPTSAGEWTNVQLVRTLEGHETVVDSLVFSPDGKMLISGGGDNDAQIRLWWVNTGTQIDRFRAHRTAVFAMTLSPNGETLATAGTDAAINLWNWETGDYTRTFLDPVHNTLSLAITPDSQVLISGGLDGIRVWNLRTQRPLYTLARFDPTYALAVNPNGYILASGGSRGEIKFWNLRTAQLVSEFSAHADQISAIAFTPDGSTMVTGSRDRTIKVWNASTGQLLRTLSGHTGAIRALTLHPDGETLASGSDDGVRLWNLQSGELLSQLSGHTDWIGALAFSRDGRMLASGGFDRTINLWQPASQVVRGEE